MANSSSHHISKKMIQWIIIFTVLLSCLLVVTWFFLPKPYVWTNDAYIESYGVQISADIPRRIAQIHVEEGDFVEKGELLIDLERDILQAELVEASAHVSVMRETLRKEEALFAKARDDFIIAKEEFEKEIIPFLTFDHQEKNYQIAVLGVQVAKSSLEEALAAEEVISAKLHHTKIVAPRSGYIAKRWILPGDVATVGAPLFTLHELDFLWVTAKLEETKLGRVSIGDKVTVSVDCYPDRTLQGRVWVIKPSAASKFALIPPSNATGNFTKVVQRIPVKIALEKPAEPLYLFPGMSCEVEIHVN